VKAPRRRAFGTSGTVALEGGFLTATGRQFATTAHDVEEDMLVTEIFRFQDGAYQGSVAIPGRWLLMDVDRRGGLLMAIWSPELPLEPLFIRVPVESLHPGPESGRP